MSDADRMMHYDANKKSVGVAYLLWFFMGLIGAHRFYLGRTGSGMIILVIALLSLISLFSGELAGGFSFLFILGIWDVIDLFPFRDSHENTTPPWLHAFDTL